MRVHDARERTLATKMGDVSFRCRRCRDEAGRTVVPLADALGLQWGARVSPAARAFLVGAGAEVSFASSAALLASAGGSAVSAPTVMRAVRRSGSQHRLMLHAGLEFRASHSFPLSASDWNIIA